MPAVAALKDKMTIEICAASGFDEVGRNMVAVRVDDDVVICDIGLHLENYIKVTDEEEDYVFALDSQQLKKAKAIPDDASLKDWRGKVRAIIPSHAHLDHLGAIPYLAGNYDAPIIGTPYTIQVLRHILKDNKISLKNRLKTVELNGTVQISKKLKVELVGITHSTPHSALVVIHTAKGAVVYSNDFKLDDTPTLGKPPNYRRMEQLGNEGVLAAFVDTTNADVDSKTPSEQSAQQMLHDVLLTQNHDGRGIIVTTFSSHIARLKSIVELGRKLNRKIVILGRSMCKYITAAEDLGIVKLSDKAEIVRFSRKAGSELRKIEKEGKRKYLIICTGHQGEPKSVLSKIASGQLEFRLEPRDAIIFSCRVIPTPTNRANRQRLESQLRRTNVRIFKDVHQSGHASGHDLKRFLELLKPREIIPSHGDKKKKEALLKIAVELGYDKKRVHLMRDGQRMRLDDVAAKNF